MKNIKVVMQYRGTRYRGWQRQSTTDMTIQGKLEHVVSKMCEADITVDGAGRTDAGVHAKCQVANFHVPEGCADSITPIEMKQYMNEYLPSDIRVTACSEASPRFHSRLNAVGKVYLYRLQKADCFDVFSDEFVWKLSSPVSLPNMREAAELLLGTHDFAGFCTKASKKKSTVRRMDSIEITETKEEIQMKFHGNGFLYNMVRILVGTLVEVGEGRRTKDTITQIFEVKKRELAGEKAPACGLTLWEVQY